MTVTICRHPRTAVRHGIWPFGGALSAAVFLVGLMGLEGRNLTKTQDIAKIAAVCHKQGVVMDMMKGRTRVRKSVAYAAIEGVMMMGYLLANAFHKAYDSCAK